MGNLSDSSAVHATGSLSGMFGEASDGTVQVQSLISDSVSELQQQQPIEQQTSQDTAAVTATEVATSDASPSSPIQHMTPS